MEQVHEETPASGGLVARFSLTAEVVVSKIAPAGFGWQSASIVADGWGFAADSAQFALTTGAGDATGVFLGHAIFYGIKKQVVDPTIEMGAQLQTGFLLATAAFHAGTAWQPIVNFLHDQAHCTFNQTLAGTTAGCGFMFYIGLRVGRSVYPAFMPAVEPPSYDNIRQDAALSLSIGGATACFVGTDVSFAPADRGH
jgi:hypothetical protein